MTSRRKMTSIDSIKKSSGILLFFLFLFPLISCDRNAVLDNYQRIPDSQWKKDSPVKIETDLTDSKAVYDIYFQVRNTTDYEYSNLYLFVNTTLPDATKTRDTLECILAAPDGTWIGKGFGKIKESRWLMKKGMMIKKPGHYKFEIEQAMREDNLKGIADIGLKIEKQ
ncbi:MAG: gliding motility lipoprotein GldH [Bacteroidota bacterium]